MEPTIPRPPADADVAPLAAAQDGMVWHEHFSPGSFNLSPPVRRYRGRLDVAALEAAVGEIVRRHAALRTTFAVVGGHGVQVFHPYLGFELPVVDVSDLPDAERLPSLARLVADARSRPFDLTAGPLFAPTLVRFGPEDHVMVIRTHHAVYDDWSVGLFRSELSALYRAFLAGDPSPLPELPVTLPDAVRRRAAALDGDQGEVDRSFWRQELAGAPLSVQLPIDDPARPAGSPHRPPPPMTLELAPNLASAVRDIARTHRATPFMVLLAAFAVLVRRYTGQDDLLVSTLAANRPEPELEGLIGCFGKKVLVRLRLDGDPAFPELVTRVRRAVMSALAHQGPAYERVLQEHLGPPATAQGLSPQVALKFQAAIVPAGALELPGVTTEPVALAGLAGAPGHFLAGETKEAVEDEPLGWGSGLYRGAFLGVSVVDTGDSVRLVTEGVFHAPEVERLLGHFRTLVADIAANPDRPVSELAVVDESTPSAVPTTSRRTAAPPLTTAGSAVVSGDVRLTREEIDARAAALAAALVAEGVGPETPVGIHLPGGPDLVVAVAGVWRAGGAVVGLAPGDLPERLAWALRDSGATVVVSDAPVAGVDRTIAVPGARGGTGPERATVAGDPARCAYVFYGSSDRSVAAGVEIEHGSLAEAWESLRSGVPGLAGRGLRWCAPAAAASSAFGRGLMALAAGHTLHLLTGAASRVALLGAGEIDVVDCTPGELAEMLDAGLQDQLDRRAAGVGGTAPVLLVETPAAVPPEVWSAWRRIRGAQVVALHGPPECSFAAAAAVVAEAGPRPVAGRPLAGATAAVLDAGGRPVPARALGELHLGGPVLARGYHHDPVLTAERLRPHPGGGRMFHTGHEATQFADGAVELLPFNDESIDLRGFRVEPGRVEAALAGCPGVRELAVVAGADDEHRFLTAYVEVDPNGPAPTLRDLRAWLWSRLPGYAWPAVMVEVDAIPRLASGQPDTVALPRPPAPVPESDPAPDVQRLAAEWAKAAGVDRMPPDANYWQSFAFLEALAAAATAGVPVLSPRVLRNRTLEMLGTDLAANCPGAEA